MKTRYYALAIALAAACVPYAQAEDFDSPEIAFTCGAVEVPTGRQVHHLLPFMGHDEVQHTAFRLAATARRDCKLSGADLGQVIFIARQTRQPSDLGPAIAMVRIPK